MSRPTRARPVCVRFLHHHDGHSATDSHAPGRPLFGLPTAPRRRSARRVGRQDWLLAIREQFERHGCEGLGVLGRTGVSGGRPRVSASTGTGRPGRGRCRTSFCAVPSARVYAARRERGTRCDGGHPSISTCTLGPCLSGRLADRSATLAAAGTGSMLDRAAWRQRSTRRTGRTDAAVRVPSGGSASPP